MTLVNDKDLSNYMGGVTFTPPQIASINGVILPGIQEDLEMHLNRLVEPVLVRENLTPDFRGYIRFTHAPVWQIMSIKRLTDNTNIDFSQFTPPPLPQPPNEDIRVLDYAGLGQDADPYEFFVGVGAFPNVGNAFLSLGGFPAFGEYAQYGFDPRQFEYYVEYKAGYYGPYDNKLKLAILEVASREADRMYSDNVEITDGQASASKAADTRTKGWQDDELKKFTRLKRRVIVG